MRLLIEWRDKPPVTTHFIKEELQRRVKMTLRDEDVKNCLDELVQKKWCNLTRFDESGTVYKINEDGVRWWSESGSKVGEFLFLMD